MRGVRVAVTGASGFCGAVVARAAARAGAQVLCLGRRPGPVGIHIPWDAARERPDLAGADVVLHLAAAVGDPRRPDDSFVEVNVNGTARLLEAARNRPVVFVSSSSVYDPRLDRCRVTEDHPIGGHLNEYGQTKAAGERLALAAGAVVLRPRAVYGPGDPHLAPRLRRAVRGRVLLLPGPDVLLSLTAVENLADACLAAAGWQPGPYNIADAQPYRRDAAIAAVLAEPASATRAPSGSGEVRVVHVPTALVMGLARLCPARMGPARMGPARMGPAGVTPYLVDQLAHDFVLDIGRALAQGWRPRRTLADHLGRTLPGAARDRILACE